MGEKVVEKVPNSVMVRMSPQTLRRTTPAIVGFTAFFAFFMFGIRGWGALAMVPFVWALWLVQLRLPTAHIEFTPRQIHVRATFRWAQISTDAVTDIILSARPGIAYVITNDGGSAEVPMSAQAIEVAQERRVREHELGMLERMYAATAIRISGENRTRTLGMNRSSAQVQFHWISFERRELLVLAAILAFGVLCFLVPVAG